MEYVGFVPSRITVVITNQWYTGECENILFRYPKVNKLMCTEECFHQEQDLNIINGGACQIVKATSNQDENVA